MWVRTHKNAHIKNHGRVLLPCVTYSTTVCDIFNYRVWHIGLPCVTYSTTVCDIFNYRVWHIELPCVTYWTTVCDILCTHGFVQVPLSALHGFEGWHVCVCVCVCVRNQRKVACLANLYACVFLCMYAHTSWINMHMHLQIRHKIVHPHSCEGQRRLIWSVSFFFVRHEKHEKYAHVLSKRWIHVCECTRIHMHTRKTVQRSYF